MFQLYFNKFDKICGLLIESNKKFDLNDLESVLSIKFIKLNELYKETLNKELVLVGPIPNFRSSWSSNVLSFLHQSGYDFITKIEMLYIFDISKLEFDKMTQTIYDSLFVFPDVDKYHHQITYSLDLEEISDFFTTIKEIDVDNIKKINKQYSLGFDLEDIYFYQNLFRSKLKRNPTNIELFDLSQSNSEHSRHWFFNGRLCYNSGMCEIRSLFQHVKSTLNIKNNKNSLIAFKDNSSCIEGYPITNLFIDENRIVKTSHILTNPTLTAETHNFPTGICPFEGAATGIGGRIRDNLAVGRGGSIIASSAGYCVGNLNLPTLSLFWEKSSNRNLNPPSKILIDASNGASDYGNKIGEPIIYGFTRSFGLETMDGYFEWLKPVMFTGGIGQVFHDNVKKKQIDKGDLVVMIGGPAYRIGLGGGSASSRHQDSENKNVDYSAVQRGDPEMENKLYRVIRSCTELFGENPIKSIHDQGAGGMGNVAKEIISPNGGVINLDNVHLGDSTLSPLEIWCSEYQEQVMIVIDPINKELIESIGKRENVPISFIGEINDSKKITVLYKDKIVVDLPLSEILENVPKKGFKLVPRPIKTDIIEYNLNLNDDLSETLYNVFNLVSVGSKEFLVHKVDRSVTGLIAQQQCVGKFQLPLSDYSLVAQSYFCKPGIASSIGEQPIKGLLDIPRMVRMTVGECLTNLMFVKISNFKDIKLSGNWMWPSKYDYEGYYLSEAVKELAALLKILNIGIDGGKDSLSMKVETKGEVIKSPRSLVLTSYVGCPNILKKVTPDFKGPGNYILFVDLGYGGKEIGGSAFSHTIKQLGHSPPDFRNPEKFKQVFDAIQELIDKDYILSGHDRSDGGLITTLIEMTFPNQIGCSINYFSSTPIEFWFNEELGLILEIASENFSAVFQKLVQIVPTINLGYTNDNNSVRIGENPIILHESVSSLLKRWRNISYHLDLLQTNKDCVIQEYKDKKGLEYFIPEEIIISLSQKIVHCPNKPRIGIIRDEGSNGDREMSAVFHIAGFEVVDIKTQDLIENDILSTLRGVVFVGGFTYSDVFGSARGWYNVIKNNKIIKEKFDRFYNRDDTFSLGVCNGCQLMIQLGWVKSKELLPNISGRFESRFSNVKILDTSSILLKGMKDLEMGIWVAHSEGNFSEINKETDYPMRYIKDDVTEEYPYNPNGSKEGVAAICSKNGRHLAMMPHPERCFMDWQLPYKPKNCGLERLTPWFLIFRNAYDWCIKN